MTTSEFFTPRYEELFSRQETLWGQIYGPTKLPNPKDREGALRKLKSVKGELRNEYKKTDAHRRLFQPKQRMSIAARLADNLFMWDQPGPPGRP